MPLDLLNDPLIETNAGWVSLPGLFASMARGEVQRFAALRPHQRPAWHMFTVQLAVLALDAVGLREVPEAEDGWRAALRALTPQFANDAPWHLIGDPRQPAFLQSPDPGGLKWTEVATPDALDMLITSRNHDVKREIARHATPQDWIFALVSLQTMEGFGGAGNYGIARMNGGSSSRVLLGLAPASGSGAEIDTSAWWRRDVVALLANRAGASGKALVWLEPWPEGHSLDLGSLDPLFIEVCRPVRLVQPESQIAALRSTSKAARIAGKDAKGNTGDPWAPIHIADGKSLTLGERDFNHEFLVSLMFSAAPEWHLPLLAREHAQENAIPMMIVAEAFSRGNSKTDGFKSRLIPVPKAMVDMGLFGQKSVAVAAELLKDIAQIDLALRNALALVAAGGVREKVAKPHYARSRPARDAFNRWVEMHFFDNLWKMATAKTDDDFRPLRLYFLEGMAKIARFEFRAALPSVPCASMMRPKAETRGWQKLETGLFFAMRDLKEETAHV
jgi:CRISPR system Cascade subunit CasA